MLVRGEHLHSEEVHMLVLSYIYNTVPEVNAEVSPYDDKILGNPIGMLQEMCVSRRRLPPSYEMVNEGLPNEHLFTIVCIVFKHRETGTGTSRKLAKRQAAHKMWERLRESLNSSSCNLPGSDDGNNDEMANCAAGPAAHYADLKDSKT
jgi:RISC-loading complex subunit TARBP2